MSMWVLILLVLDDAVAYDAPFSNITVEDLQNLETKEE